MLTSDQLAARKIGGSDVATILGVNPYKTAEELRLEILGRLPIPESTERTEAGEVFEAAIRELYRRRTGRTVHQSHQTLINDKYPWLTAHIDGRIVGERRGLECKLVHWRMARLWGDEGSDEIADYYLPQVLTYLLVTGYEVWDVAAFFGELKVYEIAPDKEWFEIILDRTHDFWHVNVLQDLACKIDPTHPNAVRALRRIYAGTSGEVIQADDTLDAWWKT